MIDEYDILEPNLRKQTYPELHVTLLGMADALERHPFFKDNWAPYVPGPSNLRAHAYELKELGVGADRGDRGMKADRDLARGRAELSFDVAIKYMVIRAVEQKNPSLLLNAGAPLKVKPAKSASRATHAASVQITLIARHIRGQSGVALLEGKHIRQGGPYQLQICKGEPVSDESWHYRGGHYKSCGKIVVKELEPANWYYFRIRTDGPEGPGPWSQVASLIIL